MNILRQIKWGVFMGWIVIGVGLYATWRVIFWFVKLLEKAYFSG